MTAPPQNNLRRWKSDRFNTATTNPAETNFESFYALATETHFVKKFD